MCVRNFLDEWYSESPYIRVHTSGSTGKPKELHVEKARMMESAKMTCEFLGLQQGDCALLCMPLDYIAGKMMVVRSIIAGMNLISVKPAMQPLKYFCGTADDNRYDIWQFASGKQSENISIPIGLKFAAMVPSQARATLDSPEETAIFRGINNIIIGGGSIDTKLEAQLRDMPNAIWSTYGMTETLSHIAMRRVSGKTASQWYTPMKGISLSLAADGALVIDAPRLCPSPLTTNDIAEFNASGQFRILGRKDNVINSGGVKIQIEEVERKLSDALPNDMAEHFAITSCPDERFGEAVVILTDRAEIVPALPEAISQLPPYWRPKRIQVVAQLPKTGSGKPDRAATRQLVSEKP
ncbi:MAG: AMP-binding protein [Bacteroides sp.]|nr:AMP-binding protein [Roseburia sp.]MCM1346173.1 AMP-binding protein [Bacteroides sp.]MCM1420976.1 AMP-binding protein [Bacteroides sp.]